MIKTDAGVTLIAAIGKTFNFPNVQTQKAGNEGFEKISTVVQRINGDQHKELVDMAAAAGAKIELKRSGTGIAIYLN